MEKNVLNALWEKINDVFASKADFVANMDMKQDVLIPGRGIKISGDVIYTDATEEIVHLSITSDVVGVDVSGLTVQIYYNESLTPSTSVTTDDEGKATFIVPHDYRYKLVFPHVEGCEDIYPVVHDAVLVERSIEVEYTEGMVEQEHVRVTVRRRTVSSESVVTGASVTVVTSADTVVYTTDSSGVAQFDIPIGVEYTVSVPSETDYNKPSPATYTASRTNRGITMLYRYATSSLMIVTNDDREWVPEDFYTAVSAGTMSYEDAVFVEFSTNALVDKGGVFFVSIDMIANNSYPSNQRWASSNVLFSSIPENGNSSSALYYYDGYTASKMVQNEGDEKSIDTPAVDTCLSRSIKTNEGLSNEQTYQGFLGSVGQWSVLWSNVLALDDIVMKTRPNYVAIMSAKTGNKWTVTQNGATSSCHWTAAPNGNYKTNSVAVVPFFAFVSSNS